MSCVILGLLPDREMRAIVQAYSEVKGLIDTYHANSDLYDLYQTADDSES